MLVVGPVGVFALVVVVVLDVEVGGVVVLVVDGVVVLVVGFDVGGETGPEFGSVASGPPGRGSAAAAAPGTDATSASTTKTTNRLAKRRGRA